MGNVLQDISCLYDIFLACDLQFLGRTYVPFCIHPGTGRVCVPVDPAKVQDFRPEDVPTVGQLIKELDDAQAAAAASQAAEGEGDAPMDEDEKPTNVNGAGPEHQPGLFLLTAKSS